MGTLQIKFLRVKDFHYGEYVPKGGYSHVFLHEQTTTTTTPE